jgi:hypothetical protein
VQRALIGTQEGLTLYFRTRLDRFDRVLVEGTIVGVLGKDTDCDIAEFRNGEDGAVVRLTARQRVDLEQVAEALYRKVWEEEQKLAQDDAQRDVQAEDRALVRIVNLLHNPQLREGLGGLRDRLDAMELHEPDESPVDSAALVHFNGGRIPRDKIEAASLRWRLRLRHDDHGGSQYEIGRPWRVLLHHAPEDAASADELRKHLSPLVREGLVVISAPLLPGTTIAQEEQRRLHESDVLLALVSADYWASDDCHAFLHQALQRPSGQLRVVPVLVRSTTLDGTRFIGLRPLPENGRAVAEWRNQDSAWASVANGLRLLVRSTL